MRFIFMFIFFFFFFSKAYSEIAQKIINTLEKADNYNFKFTQRINEKKETGNCILVFNRKINCKYDKSGKILISDGTNLIIKTDNSDIPNFYKLKNTTFYKLLDKQYLIDELKSNDIKRENGKIFINTVYQNFYIKVFFDKEKLYLKGWKTTDLYNNSVYTEIRIQEINKIIDKNLFKINQIN